MFLTGFADEASSDLAVQIQATRELDWQYIETRNINGKTLGTLSDGEFAGVEEQLAAASVKFNCYGSSIANWACHPRKEEDFQRSLADLQCAIPRMHKLGIKLLRGMSFLTPADEQPDSPELEAIIFKKVRHLVEICADNGIVYGHENCMNYGGLSHEHTLKMLDKVNHSNLKLIYDTGNPCFNYRTLGSKPYPLQSSWEFYKNVREHIVYVHIKDALALPRTDGQRPETVFTWAGEGAGDVRAIVKDLLQSGYDGGFSIEPHIATVFHAQSQDHSLASAKYTSYIEYGRRFEKLLKEVRSDL